MLRVGYWISEKKSKKQNFEENKSLFRNAGIELIKLDLSQPLEEQGPLDCIVHKVTDILAKANSGNVTAQHLIHNIQSYVDSHPECVVLDPLESTRCLLDRYKQYQQICSCQLVCRDNRVIIPKFVELRTANVEENKVKLANAGVTFPLVVKPILSHGSRLAHEMAIIFNEECLRDVEAPCVAQSFLNHNALLYKIFVVGNQQFVVERPSLKNLYPGNQATIFFDTQEVSKPGSSHPLNEIDAGSIEEPLVKPDWSLLKHLGAAISRTMDMSLIGIDVIIDCRTQQYAIIDINSFPGFEGVDDFFMHLRDHILECLRTRHHRDGTTTTTTSSSSSAATTTTTLPQRFTVSPSTSATMNCPNTWEGRVDRMTVVTNAANLKASQQSFVVSQSPVIDCRAVWTANGDLASQHNVNCSTRGVGVGRSEGGGGGGAEEEDKKERFMRQLRAKNNKCATGLLPP